MGDEIKFTQEELNAIAELQQQYNAVTFRFGQLYLEKEAIEARMTQNAIEFENTKKELDAIRTKEKTLGSTFQTKYGDGQLDLQTGVFTPVTKLPV